MKETIVSLLLMMTVAVSGLLLGLTAATASAQDNEIDTTLLTAQSALNTAATLDLNQLRDLAVYATWSTGVSAGAVAIEEATSCSYTGTWSVIATLTTSAADSIDTSHINGVFRCIRVRISTALVGGTVTVDVIGK